MKVGLLMRANKEGHIRGGYIQINNTVKALEELGVTIIQTDSVHKLPDDVDVCHIVGLQEVDFSLAQLKLAKKRNFKTVLSPIWWDFEKLMLDEIWASNLSHGRKWAKLSAVDEGMARALFQQWFHVRQAMVNRKRAQLCRHADLTLPNSPGEAEQVNKLARTNIRYHVVRNGVNEEIFQVSSDLQERDIPLLYVGLVDRTKNIHRLVQAVTAVNVPLTVIGQEPDAPYSQYCRSLDKLGLVTWLGKTTHEKLVDYYNRSHVVVLNSFRETPGLTLLEGAACGANVIATKIGSAKEYFEGFAHYCDPFSIEEISNAIRMSLSKPSPNLELSRMVRSNYTWHLAARDTLEGYQKVLS